MKRVGPLLPLMQQATLALGVGVIASLCCLFEVLFRTHVHTSFTLWSILYSAFGLASFVASIWLSFDLRTGIESERWPEAEIDRFRTTFDKPWLTGLVISFALAALVFTFFNLLSSHPHHTPGYGYGFLFFSQMLTQFSMAVRRPRPRSNSERSDWRNAPPVTSDHWGQHS